MAAVSLYYGTKAKLDATSYTDGAMYVCTDEGILYVDVNNNRIAVGGVSNLGDAASYNVDTEITNSATDDALPTSLGVKNYVDTKLKEEVVYSSTEPAQGSAKLWVEIS